MHNEFMDELARWLADAQRAKEICPCGHTYGRHYDLGGCHDCGCTEPFKPVSTVERNGE
jgi:hypothetical protein